MPLYPKKPGEITIALMKIINSKPYRAHRASNGLVLLSNFIIMISDFFKISLEPKLAQYKKISKKVLSHKCTLNLKPNIQHCYSTYRIK